MQLRLLSGRGFSNKWHSASRAESYIANLVWNGVYIIHKMASQSTSGKISDLYELKEELGK